MIWLFVLAVGALLLLAGVLAYKLQWVKSGGELGQARRAEAARWAPEPVPPRGYSSWEMYWGYKESEGPR